VSAARRKAALLGDGQSDGGRGAGWAARFALMGWDVDVAGDVAAAQDALDRMRPLLPGLYDAPPPPEGQLRATDVQSALAGAEWVIEAARGSLLPAAQAGCTPGVPVACTRGVPLADLRAKAARPDEVAVAELADPDGLLPFAELACAPALEAKARTLLEALGLQVIAGEGIAARLRDGLSEARASLAEEGVAGADIDAVLAQAIGPACIAAGDPALAVAVARAYRSSYRAAAAPLRGYEAAAATTPADLSAPFRTLAMQVPPDWADYNGHMTEAKYLEAFGFATDRFMALVGIDPAYIASGLSLFTVETHIRHLDEIHVGARFEMMTRVLQGGGKKISLWHEMLSGGRLCATAENLMLHVSLETRRSCPPREDVAALLARMAEDHASAPLPEGLGRHVGQRG